jgi:hypothetical protein
MALEIREAASLAGLPAGQKGSESIVREPGAFPNGSGHRASPTPDAGTHRMPATTMHTNMPAARVCTSFSGFIAQRNAAMIRIVHDEAWVRVGSIEPPPRQPRSEAFSYRPPIAETGFQAGVLDCNPSRSVGDRAF